MFVSNSDSVQQICDRYFSTTHTWMPIISKKRMNLGYQLWEGGPDLALLFLTMKLISSPLSDGEIASANHLYGISKRFLSLLDVSGCVSLIHLQGMFLVALYEFSHGIYPAAWMSVAACVRYAEMLGLPNHGDSKYLLGQSVSLQQPRGPLLTVIDHSNGCGGKEANMVGGIRPRPCHMSRQ